MTKTEFLSLPLLTRITVATGGKGGPVTGLVVGTADGITGPAVLIEMENTGRVARIAAAMASLVTVAV